VNVVYPGSRCLSAKVRAFSDFVAGIYPRAGVWAEIPGNKPTTNRGEAEIGGIPAPPSMAST
jgi:hypothetical protein